MMKPLVTHIPQVEFLRQISESSLHRLGLGLPENWEVDCFGLHHNRLILSAGKIVGALITHNDFGHEAPRKVDELVAIEILPAYRRKGLATAAIRALAYNNELLINSPNAYLLRALKKTATVAVDAAAGTHRVKFHLCTPSIRAAGLREPAVIPRSAHQSEFLRIARLL